MKAPLFATPQVVGTVHSSKALRHALRLKPGAVDLLELRVDHFTEQLRELLAAAPDLAFPCIVTVRNPREGGAVPLRWPQREHLYRQFLPHGRWMDVELRQASHALPLLTLAREAGTRIILSQHHFKSTPPLAQLRAQVRAAGRHRPDIFKLATLTERPEDAARLLSLLGSRNPLPLSVMGMGSLGRAARLLFARAGSCLNYGYLGEPQVSGQWSAPLLKSRLAELEAEV